MVCAPILACMENHSLNATQAFRTIEIARQAAADRTYVNLTVAGVRLVMQYPYGLPVHGPEVRS